MAVKITVVVVIAILLYFKFRNEQDLFRQMLALVKQSLSQNWLLYLVVLLLMPVNWGLESLKWYWLVRGAYSITISQAVRGVLAGLTLGFATPHALGDYVGRIYSLHTHDRKPLIGSVFLSRASQMLATMLFGCYGLYYLIGSDFLLAYGMESMSLVLVMVIFTWLTVKYFNPLKAYLTLLNTYSIPVYLGVVGMAILRYVVFSIQFVLVLHIYMPSMSLITNAAGVTFIFLAKSILPTLNFLSDLGVREYSAIYFFEKSGEPLVPVLCASLTIWVINILMPTIIGMPAMFKLKYQ